MTVGPAVREAAAAIDWRQPWFAAYQRSGSAVAAALVDARHVASVAGALNPQRQPGAVRFVGAECLPVGQHYEPFIHVTRSVPTRDNLHDLFNGLVWLAFPLAKQRLNALQAEAIASAGGVQATRGALRDAITVFDENGALLQAPAALLQALEQRDWRGLFVERRALWRDARLVLFGHALLEKLVRPRKAICAHVLPLGVDSSRTTRDAGALDAALAALLGRETLSGKPFLPLPVLGVPGWWAGNKDPAFYDDAAVFRPPASAAPGTCLKPGAAPASVAPEPAGIPTDRLFSSLEPFSI